MLVFANKVTYLVIQPLLQIGGAGVSAGRLITGTGASSTKDRSAWYHDLTEKDP